MKRIALITSLSLGLALGATAQVAAAGASEPSASKFGSVQPNPRASVRPSGFRWLQPKGVRWSRAGGGAAIGPNGTCYRC